MSNEVTITVKVDDKSAAGFASVEKNLRTITTAAKSARTALAGAARSLQGSFDNAGRGLDDVGKSATKMGQTVGSAATSATMTLAGFASQMVTSGIISASMGAQMTAATGGLNLVVGAFLAMAAAGAAATVGVVALGPALLAIGGFAGAAHSALAGLAVAIATVGIGLGGIGAALSAHGKQTGGGGGGGGGGAAAKAAEAAARAVQSASRALRDAKRAEVEAIKAVNQARLDEIERLQDLDLALRGQKISQREASQALVEATEKNRRAQQAGSAWEKAEAANAVERARYQYDSVSEKLDDLTQDKRKAAKVGVEGSDQVQKALQAEAKAHEQTVLAAQSLADAQKNVGASAGGAAGGINAFNEAMKKLSPNARELVYALIDIQKRFEPIKRAVQDRFLDGWADSSTKLYDKWEKHLGPMLGTMADKFNGLGKAIMKSLGDSTFIKNMETSATAFGTFIDHLKDAGTAGTDSFGRISAAATPVLDKIGDLLERVFVKFNKWIRRVEDSGALDTFMKDAADNLELIAQIGGKAFTIMGQFIGIIFPQSKSAGQGVFESVNTSLGKVSAWLADPANQAAVRKHIDDMIEYGRSVWGVIKFFIKLIGWLSRAGRAVHNWQSAMGRAALGALRAMGNAMTWIIRKGEQLGAWFRALPGRLRGVFSNMWNGLVNSFGRALNWIQERWNRLRFPAPSFGGAIGAIGGFFTGNATGGVTRGGWSEINERGREMVKLPTGSLVMPHSNTQNAMMGGGPQAATFVLKSSGNRMDDLLLELLRGRIRSEGGNVQLVLGGRRLA